MSTYSEIWVADKGEANGFFGRTLTVFDTATGSRPELLIIMRQCGFD